MRIPIENFKGVESGPCVILGNGPSLDNYVGKQFACPIIGINYSADPYYWPEQDYYVTVAFERLAEITAGKIRAKKAVFACLQKAHVVPDTIEQPITYANMSLPDVYTNNYKRKCLFNYDLTKPTHATFGGIYSIQVGMFLGYNPIYLVGFDGGGIVHCEKYPRKKGYIPVQHHLRVHWHVAYWLQQQNEIEVFQTNPDAAINYYPLREAPLK